MAGRARKHSTNRPFFIRFLLTDKTGTKGTVYMVLLSGGGRPKAPPATKNASRKSSGGNNEDRGGEQNLPGK